MVFLQNEIDIASSTELQIVSVTICLAIQGDKIKKKLFIVKLWDIFVL